ncbi:MAG TPA: LytTR family DNA-binding domain-containing protein [Puia sp.]|uniref:LytR/AlgR family response regulator transcription factor n=1 Tax=Puia sp. TaxID=2045100 RepID=UPI002BF48A95|nr:LytTR family DNA-binding domain-containing protein [Puia sp.]HVU96603.1 LytTR family DNA-binding domain-containing protein [Puia sp.]
MLLRAVIVDDEPVARKVIKEYLEDIEFLELAGMAENPLKADALLGSGQVDLLFLDINMPKLSGIEFLRASAGRFYQPMVIITTAYAEYALDGFELDVVDYLVKPFSFERFLRACNKARSKYGERVLPAAGQKADHFFVKCDGSLVKVLYEELEYVEAMTNYIVLHTRARPLIVYLTMKGVLAHLPAGRFVKVHKSFIVNKDRIKSIRGNVLQLGAAEVPVSQHYFESAMQEILRDRVLKRE